jgi:TonB-dependent starch-binding outer membrane protein SusC
MNPKYILLLYLFCAGFLMKGIAQSTENTVTAGGRITDAGGKPLEGVTVQVQEKTTGVATDADGRFSLQVKGNDVLTFQKNGFISFQKASLELNDITLVMTESLIDAGDDDNVRIPFDVRKRRAISASVSTIKGSELPRIPLSSINSSLAGRLSGLYIKQGGTRPGVDDATLLVRGRSSYNSNQQPLVLVDGVVRDFASMDPGEIESISVLKDAATLSWYGMNGANGVVFVTTRRGSATSTKVTFDAQTGVQTPAIITKPLNSYEYATLYNQSLINSGLTPRFNQATLDAYQADTNRFLFPNNNFVDQFMKKASMVQRYVATISGGNAFARYFTLLSYYNQGGLYKGANNDDYDANTNYRRYNFRTNLDLHINKNLDVILDVGGRVEQLRYPSAGNASLLNTIYNTPPNAFPVLNEDGTYGGNSLFQTSNPMALLNADGNTTSLTRTMLATLDVRYKLDAIAKGLSLNLFYTYDITSAYVFGYTQDYEVYEKNAAGYTRYGTATPLKYSDADFNSNVRNNEFWGGFDYDRQLGQHALKFSTRFQTAVSAAPARLDNTRTGVSNRLSYDFKRRYFIDLVTTYAGSQNFAPGKRFGWFPAVSAGWIISEEKFLRTSSFLNYLKLRGSVGVVGNDGISARRFAYNNYFTRGGTQYFFGTGFSNVPNSTELELANPNLTWEKAQKASMGFDAKFFGQSLSLAADYFYEKRTDLLTTALLPNVLGQAVVDVNDGQAQYKGVEAMIGYDKKIGQVTLSLNGNVTYAVSKVIAINEEAGLPYYQRQRNYPVGSVAQLNSETSTSYINRFLIADGIFQNQAEIDAAPVQRFSGVTRPGDIRYRDINDDKVIDNLDYVMTGHNDIPKLYFGFGASLRYRHLDLSAQFQGVHDRTISINNLVNSGTSATGYINQFSKDAWTVDNTSAPFPRTAIADRGNNTVNSTFWLRSGDFLKLRSVELGYNLPMKQRLLRITSCRFYLMGFNLLTISKANDLGLDPEIPTAGYNTSYPYLRTFAAGVNLRF